MPTSDAGFGQPGTDDDGPRVVVVSGMSGAGRSTAAHVLEDLGWFVVDNLPPALLGSVLDLVTASTSGPRSIGVVVDVRSGSFFADLVGSLAELDRQGVKPSILFLEATDEVLVRRYESVRRPHPLQAGGRVVDGIERERAMMADLRGSADLVIDTSALNVHELTRKLVAAFAGDDDQALHTTIVSFGFKYGIPVDADLVFDCRFLPNPFWVPALRPHSGLDPDVSDYVLGQPAAEPFLDQLDGLLDIVAAGYLAEGKRFATIGIGCTGGKHRSVAMSEALALRLRARNVPSLVVHRDLGHE
jgi:UPF0042 nucleotide-binding protein